MNPQPQAPSRFRFLSFAPVTAALVALNVVLFAWEILHGVPLMNPSTWQVLDWGGNMPLLTLTGDWWRLPASMFLRLQQRRQAAAAPVDDAELETIAG